MKNPFSYEQFLWMCEHDDLFNIDETVFYFQDDPNQSERMLGCLSQYDKPYWAGYCDIPDGSIYRTASELLEAKIFDGCSIKDRWENIIFVAIGGISLESWLDFFQGKLDLQEN